LECRFIFISILPRIRAFLALIIKADVQDVAILHNVGFSFSRSLALARASVMPPTSISPDSQPFCANEPF
jgi:hypothetical protein